MAFQQRSILSLFSADPHGLRGNSNYDALKVSAERKRGARPSAWPELASSTVPASVRAPGSAPATRAEICPTFRRSQLTRPYYPR